MLLGVRVTTGPETVRVKFWVALPAVLVAVNVIGNVPEFVGVPLNVPVPLPLSTNPTPFGSVPFSFRLGVGYPVAVTENDPNTPSWKVALLALVIAGDCSTVSVKPCCALPALLLAMSVML